MIRNVSLCMVTYNEAHRITETLSAVAPFVDEIVVVDQKSTDDTIGIIYDWYSSNSRNPSTKVLTDFHWGFCEPSRKLAHKAADGEWILVLDADESISPDFAREMRTLDERGFKGARLKLSFWLGGEHRFTGDYQYRYFHRDAVRYLDEIHTEPQPTTKMIYSPDYVGILHEKSWEEQIRDEEAYEELLEGETGRSADSKRALNVHLALLNKLGITAQEADAMSVEERNEKGIGAQSA
jgi:glycosyltransferase involved in cell wall biosynthesis